MDIVQHPLDTLIDGLSALTKFLTDNLSITTSKDELSLRKIATWFVQLNISLVYIVALVMLLILCLCLPIKLATFLYRKYFCGEKDIESEEESLNK